MQLEASGSAPGKILWLGGYSVVERPNIGFVTAVNARVNANVISIEGNRLVMDAPQLDLHSEGTIGLNSGILSIEAPKELVLMKTSVEIASRYVAGLGIGLKGMRISTKSDPSFSYSVASGKVSKSGLGSSAAVTVATIGAILKAYGIDTRHRDALHKLAQAAHGIATGKVGSGFDIAAATHGTILYTRYSPGLVKDFPSQYTNEDLQNLVKHEWDYRIEEFRMPEVFRLLFANFVGEGMVTTSALGSVAKFKESDPNGYNELMDSINKENVKAVEALRSIKGGRDIEGGMGDFRNAFDRGRSLTKRLGILSGVGIEDDDLTELIEESKRNGAFVAKLPGAGGRDAISALTYGEDGRKGLVKFWSGRRGMQIMDLGIENSGFA